MASRALTNRREIAGQILAGARRRADTLIHDGGSAESLRLDDSRARFLGDGVAKRAAGISASLDSIRVFEYYFILKNSEEQLDFFQPTRSNFMSK